MKKPELLTVFKVGTSQITTVQFDSTSEYLIAGTKSSTSFIITFQPTHVIKTVFDTSSCQQIQISNKLADKPVIFSANLSGSVSKTTTQIKEQKNIINKKISTHPLTSISFNQRVKLLAVSQTDKYIKLYNHNLQFVKTIECHQNWVNYVSFSQNGDKLASCSDDGTIVITDIRTYRQLQRITQAEGLLLNVKQVKFVNDKQIITIGFQECQIWNWEDRTLIQHYTLSNGNIYDVCVSKNEKYGFVACQDGVKILDLVQGRIIFNIRAECSITAVDVARDNSVLSCGLEDGRILLFELKFDQQ